MVSIEKSLCVGCGSCARVCPMGVLRQAEAGTPPQVRPRGRCIACMHCAAICPRRAVRFEGLSPEEVYPPELETPLGKCIQARRSIRHFQKEPPDKVLLQKALDAASYAPSGKNERAHRWTVVWGRPAVEALADLCLSLCAQYGEAPELVKLKEKGVDLLTCGAPVLVVAWSPDEALNPVLDPAVAMAQLELLLCEQGVGTCWGGYLRQVSDRFPEVRQQLRVPDGSRVRCALMAGWPEGETYVNRIWRPAAEAVWVEAPHG